MVITIEPGLYIPSDDDSVAPEYRGIGVRIEDDFLITEDGYIHLSRGVPRSIADIEELMK
jgi:Xaa-Pro aminopeptidase